MSKFTSATKDRDLAILLLRTVGYSQDTVASILHCGKSLIGNVEDWFAKKLTYADAIDICNSAAINEVINTDLYLREEVKKDDILKLTRITPDTILRHYRHDYVSSLAWQKYLNLAAQLKVSIFNVSEKDWSIWGLRDTGEPPLTSEAGIKIWMDRGQLVVKLAVENDDNFPALISYLKASFPDFREYNSWRQLLAEFSKACWNMAHEILRTAEEKSGLPLSPFPVMGKGHLVNVPRYIYEFALDNYRSDNYPDMEILPNNTSHFRLVVKCYPDYELAIGSHDEMERCSKVTIALANQYAQDERFGKIKTAYGELKQQAAPFQAILTDITKGKPLTES